MVNFCCVPDEPIGKPGIFGVFGSVPHDAPIAAQMTIAHTERPKHKPLPFTGPEGFSFNAVTP